MLFFSLIMLYLLAGMEVDLFIPSYPELQKIFNLNTAEVQLTLSVNFITYCIGSLYAGMLGDRYGTKIIIVTSICVFILGSIFCVYSDSFSGILIGRALQGLGMSGPASLGYVVISKQYPAEEQASKFGFINGFITIGMAFAPVIGSYVNSYFGWRGNFVILLAMSIFCLITSSLFFPNDYKFEKSAEISLKAYKPLMISKEFWVYITVIFSESCAYWMFIGMGPIIYMVSMNVPIKEFGLYQGATAGVFSIVSFLSPMMMKKYGTNNCLNRSFDFMTISAFAILIVGVFVKDNPLIITGVMCCLSAVVVFPVNILYPKMLNVVKGTNSRAAALGNVVRLVFTAIGLEAVSLIYSGRFLEVSVTIFMLCIISVVFFIKYLKNKEA